MSTGPAGRGGMRSIQELPEPTLKETFLWMCCNQRSAAAVYAPGRRSGASTPLAVPTSSAPSKDPLTTAPRPPGTFARAPSPLSAATVVGGPAHDANKQGWTGEAVLASTTTSASPSAAAPAVSAAGPGPEDFAAAAPASGGAAILAQIRARKAAAQAVPAVSTDAAAVVPNGLASQKASPPPPKVVFAYASQTGTGSEIARNLHAEAVQRGMKAEVFSLNELSFQNLTPQNVPLMVLIASSTGDGDPPDNSANVWLQIKKKQPEGLLKGMRFTLLGLGDSNYTRFMHVPRIFKTRLLELGAETFYAPVEADDVDGIESVVDPWMDGLWGALDKAIAATPPSFGRIDSRTTVLEDSSPAPSPSSLGGEVGAGATISTASSGNGRVPASALASASELEASRLPALPSFDSQVGSRLSAGAAYSATFRATPTQPIIQEGEEGGGGGGDKTEAEAAVVALAAAAQAVSMSASQVPRLNLEAAGVGGGSFTAASGLSSPDGVARAKGRRASLDLSLLGKSSSNGGRPGSPGSPRTGRGSVPTAGALAAVMAGLPRPGVGGITRLAGTMMGKPSSVHFLKREEATVARKDEQTYGFNMGLAPVGADLKGAPAPLPCRVKLSWEKNSDNIAMTKLTETRPMAQELRYRDPEGVYSKEQPYWAEISDARYETAAWSDRKVLHLELRLGDSGIVYEAGDAIGIIPVNPPELVANTIKRLGLRPDDVFNVKNADGSNNALLPHVPSPCTVHYALSRCLDITGAPKKSLIRLLAEYCVDPSERRTLTYFTSRAGKDAYQHEILEHQPSLLDLLARFKTCSPPFDALVDALPPLMPRLYSVTTSFVESPDKVQVALSVVRFKTMYGGRPGVASTWLDRMTQHLTGGGDGMAMLSEDRGSPRGSPLGSQRSNKAGGLRVPIFLKRAADFKPPKDLGRPVIMVGPGTGIAPFRGFLQHRRAMIREAYPEGLPSGEDLPEGLGPSWLFFGCRREDEDFLYKGDIEAFQADRTLTRLEVAFSRAQAEKVYVQDLMKKHAGELAKMMVDQGAYVFVCGDGAGMAKDVHAALLAALAGMEGMDEAQAAQKLADMVQEKRYIRDVWS